MKQLRKGKNMFKNTLVIFAAVALSVGCVKDRPKVDAQGSNLDNLIKISDVLSWDHTVETSKESNLGETTLARNLNVDEKLKDIKFPSVVNLSSDAPLLKGSIEKIDYFGKANSVYPIKYEFGPNLLKIYKVVPDSELTHYELPYSKKRGNSWWVPIGGYQVKYFTVEFIRNTDEEDSNRKQKYRVPPEEYTRATHVEINRKKFAAFERLDKQDVLPASYFTEGDWYYSSVIISAKPEEQTNIGYADGNRDASLNKTATLIRFTKTEEQLRATNVVRDERIEISEDQADIVLNIPVDWFQSRVELDGTEEGLREEKTPNLRYDKAPWGEFDFRNIVAIKKGGTSRVQKFFEGIVLDDLTVKKNSFSFTLLYLGSGDKEKFSFLRADDRGYKAKIYYKDDRKEFGAFPVEKYRLANLDEHREADIEKNVFVQRYNPKKDIVFRFSTMTPKFDKAKESYSDDKFSMDYRELGRNCTKYWNRAFELAGTDIKVRLDESRDAELGDFDSNILNIIPILSNGGGGGVGPSVADPLTGETIAATANVFVTNGVLKGRLNKIRDFIRIESGKVPNPDLLDPDKKGIPILNQISKEVRKFCPQVVEFAHKLKEKGPDYQVSTSEENKVIIPCAEKLMKPRLQGILCHEIGHNLGLRHNFYCSADEKNMALTYKKLNRLYPREDFPEIYEEFYPEESFLPEMTCVMDYADFDEFNMPAMPMAYDIAALAYIYSNKVFTKFDLETGDIKLKSYDPNESIATQSVFQSSNRFKYCTDEDSVEGARRAKSIPIDPMCALWDNGKTPKEKMRHLFRAVRESVILDSVKYDRNFFPQGVNRLDQSYQFSITNMASIYGTWRAYLTGRVGNENKYLNNSPASVKSTIDKLSSDTDFRGSEYVGVSEVFYENLKEIMYMPQYFCIALDKHDSIQLFEFSSLQKQVVSEIQGFVVEGCSDPEVQRFLESKYGYTYVDEVGSPLSHVQYSLNPFDVRESYDILGTETLRMLASRYLTTRIGFLTQPMLVNEILPSILDEPGFYDRFINDFKQRVIEGSDPGKGFINKLKANDIKSADSFVLKPRGEYWGIYDNALRFLLVGNPQQKVFSALVIPSDRGGNLSKKINEFNVKQFNSLNLLDQNRPYYQFAGAYYQPDAEAGFAIAVMDKIKDLESQLVTMQQDSTLMVFRRSHEGQLKQESMIDQLEGLRVIFLSMARNTK